MIIIVAFPFGWSGQVRILEYYTAPFEVACTQTIYTIITEIKFASKGSGYARHNYVDRL